MYYKNSDFQFVGSLLGTAVSASSVLYYQIKSLFDQGYDPVSVAEIVKEEMVRPTFFDTYDYDLWAAAERSWAGGHGGGGNGRGGSRYYRERPVKAGRKKFKLMKLVSANLEWIEQQMGVKRDVVSGNAAGGVITALDNNWAGKHLISEYNPNTGGCVPIFKNTETDDLPMHVYELNTYVPGFEYNSLNYPLRATNQNADINAVAWVFRNDNKFYPLGAVTRLPANNTLGTLGPYHAAWYVNDAKNLVQDQVPPGTKLYRKGICVDYMFYGTRKTMMKYDIRVIKILDPKFCPDYDTNLTINDASAPNVNHLDDFRQCWQNLVRPYCINPMLKGIEPGPQVPRRWFKTIAKKTITVQEQMGDVEQVPSVQGRLYINLNEVNNMAWDQKGYEVESGDVAYDVPPDVEQDAGNVEYDTFNNTKHTKPHWKARYYLVIRALCPHDQAAASAVDLPLENATHNFEFSGRTNVDYTGTYDLAIRTTYANLMGIN